MNGLMKLRNPWMIGIEARKKSPEANQWAGKFSLNEWIMFVLLISWLELPKFDLPLFH